MSSDGKRVVTGSQDHTVKVWDTANGSDLGTLRLHSAEIQKVAMSRDGTRIVTFGANDHQVGVWDARTGELLWNAPIPLGTTIAITADDKRLLAPSAGKKILVFDLESGEQAHDIAFYGVVADLSTSPDGSLIAAAAYMGGSARSSIAVLNSSTGQLLAIRQAVSTSVNQVKWAPDGSSIIGAYDDRTIRIWDSSPNSGFSSFDGHTSTIRDIAIFPDGKRVASVSDDKTVRIWDVITKQQERILEDHSNAVMNQVVVAPDGSRIVTQYSDGSARLWNVQDGKDLTELHDDTGLKSTSNPITNVVFTHDSRRIVAVHTGDILLYDAESGARLQIVSEDLGGTPQSIAASANDNVIIISYSRHHLVFFDANSGKIIKIVDDGTKGSFFTKLLSLSRTGEWFVTIAVDGGITIWDAKRFEPRINIGRNWDNIDITDVIISPDDGSFVTADKGGKLRFWNPTTGNASREIDNRAGVQTIAFTRDGDRLIAASNDGTIKVWSLSEGVQIAELGRPSEQSDFKIVITPDTTRVISISTDDKVRVWELLPSGERLIELAKGLVPRCLGGDSRRELNMPEKPEDWCFSMGKWPVAGDQVEFANALGDALNNIINANDADTEKALEALVKRYHAMSNEISWLFSKVYVKLGLRSMVENDNSRSDVLFRIALEFDGKSAGHEAVFRNVLALSQFPLGAIADDDSAAKVLQQGIDIRSFAARLYEVATWSLYVTFRDIRPDYANRMRSILTHDPEFPFAMVDGLFWNTSNVSKEIGTKTRAEVIYDIYSKFSGIMKANGTPIPPRLNVQIDSALGDVLLERKDYRGALGAYSAARKSDDTLQLDLVRAEVKQWASAEGIHDDLIKKGDVLKAMLAQWSTLLTLDADGRAAIGLEKFIFSGMRRDIAQIYFEQMNHNNSPPPTDCDRFASNGYDPFRLSAPIEFDTIELPGALNACEEAVSQHPGDPHFRYLRGRAAHRAGVIAASAGDNDLASKRFAEARSDYEAAMAKGYPAAFNNMGQMIYYGQGVTVDRSQAAADFVQAFNRFVYCCAKPVALALLNARTEAGSDDGIQVSRALLLWSAALGNSDARTTLDELYTTGALTPAAAFPSANFSDVPPWFKK